LRELASINAALGTAEGAERAQRYTDAADAMLYSLITIYTPRAQGVASDGLMLESVYNKPYKMGINEATQFGDYYYMEALTRSAQTDWKRYW
ncbi:MAG: glucuronyl hydrolase, partial [Cellulomonadaceae bacterium]|nr:glucuronyl hydrolase [Cellulomonadaceae bacterium]